MDIVRTIGHGLLVVLRDVAWILLLLARLVSIIAKVVFVVVVLVIGFVLRLAAIAVRAS